MTGSSVPTHEGLDFRAAVNQEDLKYDQNCYDEAEAYFRGLDPDFAIPAKSNPADVYLDVISKGSERVNYVEAWTQHFRTEQAETSGENGAHRRTLSYKNERGEELVQPFPTRTWPSSFNQMFVFTSRSFAQQWHNWTVPVFFFFLLSCTGVLLGITTKPGNFTGAFTLTILAIGLTSALSGLLIFGPEVRPAPCPRLRL